jgi:site-specific DNA recombinase
MIGIYCRISKKKMEGRDTSIQTQMDSGIAFAMKNALNYELYIDTGVSGQKGADERESLDRLFNDIESKKVSTVWVIDQSRFDRNEQLWFDFQAMIVKHEIEFYVGDLRFDIENEDMRMMSNIMSAMNASYARRTGKKVKESYKQRFLAGKWVGITPYGYSTDSEGYLIIDERQALVVKRIFQMSLDGIGGYTIANMLNDDKIPVKSADFKGKVMRLKDPYTKQVREVEREYVRWRGNVITGIINNPIYKGVWILNDGKKDELVRQSPVIIEPELYDKVIDNLSNNRKNVGKREQYQYLLNGLVFCANCGKEMRGKKRQASKDSAYKCGSGLECRGINIEKTETFILNHLFLKEGLKEKLANAPKVGNEILHSLEIQLEKSNQDLKKTETRIKNLFLMLDDEELEKDDDTIGELKKAKKRKSELEEKITHFSQEIYSIKNDIPTARMNQVINEFNLDMPFEYIKKSVHSLVERIDVAFNSDKRNFLVRIKFRGFEKTSTFSVTMMLNNWRWVSSEREKAYTPEQLEFDRKEFAGYMLETFGIPMKPSDDWEGGITEPKFESIVIEKDKLIKFN